MNVTDGRTDRLHDGIGCAYAKHRAAKTYINFTTINDVEVVTFVTWV